MKKISIYEIDKYGNLLLDKRKIPLNFDNGSVTFNWYGPSSLGKISPFTYIPFYEVIEAMYSSNPNTQKRMLEKFQGKVILVGTSVEALGTVADGDDGMLVIVLRLPSGARKSLPVLSLPKGRDGS